MISSKHNSAVRACSAKSKMDNDAQDKDKLNNCPYLKRCIKSAIEKRANNNPKYASPNKKSNAQTKIMSLNEYEYFHNVAFGKSKEDMQAKQDEFEKETEKLIKESIIRKEKLRLIDMKKAKQKDISHNEIEAEKEQKKTYLLDRAQKQLLEQEEELQKCNRVILATKCRVIRDAQIEEKKIIKSQLKAEEERLNDMMENERRWKIQEAEKKEQDKIERQKYFIQVLKDQIAENEEQRYLEFERKQAESRQINVEMIEWQESEIIKMQEKQAENKRIQKQLADVNEQIKHFKRMEKEENDMIDQRIRGFQKLKDERDIKLLEEKRKLQLKKESEKLRLSEQASHAKKFQEQIEEINASKIQEDVEREWRRKEKEEAMKRMEKRKNLLLAREEQMRNKRMLQAIEIERDKREYKRVLENQKAVLIRDKKEREEKLHNAEKHKREILKQVNEKEKERLELRKQMFEEGIALKAKAEMRKNKLNEAIKEKCEEMKRANMPEMYIDEVRRLIEN